MNIILVRHGTTLSNNAKTYSEEDTPLAESAYTDLLVTKERLKDFDYEKVYVSPLLRAIQTAEVLGLKDFTLDKRLEERDFGDFKGKTYEEIVVEFPDEVKTWLSDMKHGKPPKGESAYEHFERVVDFMEEISKTQGNCLIVSHYGTITLALAWALGDFDLWTKFIPKNGGITEIKTDAKLHCISKFNY